MSYKHAWTTLVRAGKFGFSPRSQQSKAIVVVVVVVVNVKLLYRLSCFSIEYITTTLRGGGGGELVE